MPALPFKLNQDRRRHIPEQKRKVTNWRDYDESLRRRGSVTVWFSDEAVEAWEAERRTSRGGQPEYSDLAILTALTFKAVFRLAYRQTEGLIGSVIGLLGLPAPHGWLRHPVSGRDPREGDDDDRDNSFGWGRSGPRWTHVAPTQARCSTAPAPG